MKKEGGMQKRMQSFYFEFLNDDGSVKETITDADKESGLPEGATGVKPKKKPQA